MLILSFWLFSVGKDLLKRLRIEGDLVDRFKNQDLKN